MPGPEDEGAQFCGRNLPDASQAGSSPGGGRVEERIEVNGHALNPVSTAKS